MINQNQVLEAIEDAFHPTSVEPHLQQKNGRVFGSVTVVGSQTFDELDDIRRQNRFWIALRKLFGVDALDVGPVVLEPTNRG